MDTIQELNIKLQQQNQKIQQLEKQLKEKTNINMGTEKELREYKKQIEGILEEYMHEAPNSQNKARLMELYNTQRWDWIEQTMDLDKAKNECQQIVAELAAAKQEYALIEQQLVIEKAEQRAREEQVKQRRQRVGEAKELLLGYQNERNRNYKLKDTIASYDKVTRNAFINTISTQLDDAIISNEAAEALVIELTEQIPNFHGIKMKATLNKIIVKLMELGADIDTEADCHNQAEQTLKVQQGEHGEYVSSINELYEKIELMSAYGKTLPSTQQKQVVATLTQALVKDVDIFVCQNKNALPDEKTYNDFKTKFTARLHSEDDVMSKHVKGWKTKAANAVIGIISVGIALGFQLAYSKLKNHRATFFFDKTAKQKAIEAIDSALEKIPGPPPSA